MANNGKVTNTNETLDFSGQPVWKFSQAVDQVKSSCIKRLFLRETCGLYPAQDDCVFDSDYESFEKVVEQFWKSRSLFRITKLVELFPEVNFIDISGCDDEARKFLIDEGKSAEELATLLGIEIKDFLEQYSMLKLLLSPLELLNAEVRNRVWQIKSLVENCGVPANFSINKWSLLHTACAVGNAEIVEFLLERDDSKDFPRDEIVLGNTIFYPAPVTIALLLHHYHLFIFFQAELTTQVEPANRNSRDSVSVSAEISFLANEFKLWLPTLDCDFGSKRNILSTGWIQEMHNKNCLPSELIQTLCRVGPYRDVASREYLLESILKFVESKDRVGQDCQALLEGVKFILESGCATTATNFNQEGLKKPFLSMAVTQPTIVSLLLEHGASVNQTDSEGNTALFDVVDKDVSEVSVANNVLETCKLLVEYDINVNAQNQQQQTALAKCIEQGIQQSCRQFVEPNVTQQTKFSSYRATLCNLLIESGANVGVRLKEGKTLYHHLFEVLTKEKERCIDVFLKIKGHQNFQQSERNLFSRVLDLVAEFLSVLTQHMHSAVLPRSKDSNGNTPLHYMAQNLDKAQDPNNLPYSTEVQKAVESFVASTLDCLLSYGTLVNERNEAGRTPLHLASTWYVAKFLLKNKALPDAEDCYGDPPLLTSGAATQDINWAEALNFGLDPWKANESSSFASTVLGKLLKTGKFELAKKLLEVVSICDPANVNKAHTNGKTFLHIACSCYNPDVQSVIKALLELGADPNCTNSCGDSPLHIVCQIIVERQSTHNMLKSVQASAIPLLMKHGAKATTANSEGQTCLDIAKDLPSLLELLQEPMISWIPQSEKFHGQLAQVAQCQQSCQVKMFHYHNEPIGSGAFGKVFVGINSDDGREVAIKRMEQQLLHRPEARREIDNLVFLADCQHVVQLYSCQTDLYFIYIVLELMDGNLEEYLDSSPYSKYNIKLCKDIVSGLVFLHDKGILHRDIKPGNILYKTQPKLCLKLADFGLSSKKIFHTSNDLTVIDDKAGTRCWMAPELIRFVLYINLISDLHLRMTQCVCQCAHFFSAEYIRQLIMIVIT